MAVALKIVDEELGGPKREFMIELVSERVNVRDLIKNRVIYEVKEYNSKQPEYFKGLVQPTEAEKTLNGYRLKKHKLIDWQQQYEAALSAFENNRYFIIVGDRQVESLDDEIIIGPSIKVSFVKLVQLVGG